MTIAAIEADGLGKSFGRREAVRGVSFRVEAGGITGLLGANGAGKSTTMRLLTGCLRPDRGSARIAGLDIGEAAAAARAMIGYLPEAAGGLPHLTAAELLLLAAEARTPSAAAARAEVRRVSALVDLGPVLGDRLGTLSKGWRQRAWLAQALIGNPPVLVLDEPTDGLDPIQKTALRALLLRLKVGKAILMSTHILEEAEALCDRVLVLADGRVVADAPVKELADGQGRLAASFSRLAQGSSAS